MRRFVEISIPLLLLLVPEFWKSAFEWLRQSPYWRYSQILMVLWIVVVVTYPLVAYLTGVNRTTAVVAAALIGAVLFGGIALRLTTPVDKNRRLAGPSAPAPPSHSPTTTPAASATDTPDSSARPFFAMGQGGFSIRDHAKMVFRDNLFSDGMRWEVTDSAEARMSKNLFYPAPNAPNTSSPPPSSGSSVAQDKVDEEVKRWVEEFPSNFNGAQWRDHPSSDPVNKPIHFGYDLIFADGHGLAVSRNKEIQPGIIFLRVALQPDSSIIDSLNSMSPQQQNIFFEKLRVEIGRAKIHLDQYDPRKPIIFGSELSINDALTQDEFYRSVQDIHSNIILLASVVPAFIRELGGVFPTPTPKPTSHKSKRPSPKLDKGGRERK